MTATVLNTKIREVENKIPNHYGYITTPEFNMLTAERFAARLNQANLLTKTGFDNKLTTFNRQIASSKTKHLEVQKKLDSLIKNDDHFFLGRMFFTSNDGSQNTFVYQPTLETLELRKCEGTDYVLNWKSNAAYNSKLKPLYTVFLHSK